MHIIVDGVDGGGKSTLVSALVDKLGVVRHPKASTSLGGPVSDLEAWVEIESRRRREYGIYDRHPILSEPVYGLIVRNRLPGAFSNPHWVRAALHTLAFDHMVVWCIPPWEEIANNTMMRPDDHMPGVADHAHNLYDAYRVLAAGFWPGVQLVYDYTSMKPDRVAEWYRHRIG